MIATAVVTVLAFPVHLVLWAACTGYALAYGHQAVEAMTVGEAQAAALSAHRARLEAA